MQMSSLRTDFNTRTNEISCFIKLVKELEGSLPPSDPNYEGFKAMKAATHLLIYNLVESTATGIHEEIFDAITQQGVSFDELTTEMKCAVLENARRPNIKKLVSTLKTLSFDIIGQTFMKEEIYRGNVDFKKLREGFQNLGMGEIKFESEKEYDACSNSLLSIKANRNDLAHGRKSFAEVGRNMTPRDIETEVHGVRAFLDQCITLAESFIAEEQYKAS